MQVGWVKIGDFRQITGYISKTVPLQEWRSFWEQELSSVDALFQSVDQKSEIVSLLMQGLLTHMLPSDVS